MILKLWLKKILHHFLPQFFFRQFYTKKSYFLSKPIWSFDQIWVFLIKFKNNTVSKQQTQFFTPVFSEFQNLWMEIRFQTFFWKFVSKFTFFTKKNDVNFFLLYKKCCKKVDPVQQSWCFWELYIDKFIHLSLGGASEWNWNKINMIYKS